MEKKNHSFEIPTIGYIRLPQVLKIIPVGRSTWWAGCRSGKYPKPVKLSERITAWKASDIHELIKKLEEENNASN